MAMQIRKINIGTRDVVHVVALNDLGATDARAMDVSADGTLYVADAGRDVVIKVYESGRVNGAVVGTLNTPGNVNSNGIATDGNDARLNTPRSMCIDKSNNIYVGDGGAGFQVRRMSPSGVLSFLAGNYDYAGDVVNAIEGDYDNTKSRFSPHAQGMGLAVDKAGVLYLADTGNSKIKKVWNSGRTTSLAGDGTNGFANDMGNAAKFNVPKDVCVDNQGNLYVVDAGHRVRKVTEAGVVTTLAGNGTGAFVDSDNGTAVRFNNPVRICIEPNSQYLFVMDRTNDAIRWVRASGRTTTFCHYNDAGGNSIGDICVDNSGFLYILEENV